MLVLFLHWLHACSPWSHSLLNRTRACWACPERGLGPWGLQRPPSGNGSHSATSAVPHESSASRPVLVQTQQRVKTRPGACKFQRHITRSGYSGPPNSLWSVFAVSHRQSAMALLQTWKWPITGVKLQWLDMVRHDCYLFWFFWGWISKCSLPRNSFGMWETAFGSKYSWRRSDQSRPKPKILRHLTKHLHLWFPKPIKLKISLSISVSQCLRLLGKLPVEWKGNIPSQQWLFKTKHFANSAELP